MIETAGFIIQDAFWSALTSFGFAILFNAPRRALIFCAVTGAIGHALRTALILGFNMSLSVSTLIAALVVGFLALRFAQRLKMPALIFAVTGAVPMIPGVAAYQTMIAVLELSGTRSREASALVAEIASNGAQTAFVLAALGVGIVAPNLIFRRQRPGA